MPLKILLIGEYSRLHNSLKEGLVELGHDVTLAGYSDGFKDYPVDIKLERKWVLGLKGKIKGALYSIFGFDLTSYLTLRFFEKNKAAFSGFDVVQLINENSFYCQPHIEIKILDFIFKNNKKVFLLSCGDDYVNVTYNFKNPEEKSVVQPYLMGKIPDRLFPGVLKFRRADFKALHDYIYQRISAVISSDLDYHHPLLHQSKYIGLIPNPINAARFEFNQPAVGEKINIFLGINQESYFKKGIDYFEAALEIIGKKYAEKVNITIVRNKPYAEYIKLYDQAHILLDQVFAKDQGYNALEAMAKGKVVFTGAEAVFEDHYNISERVAINAVPNPDVIVEELRNLLTNRDEITAIGLRARAFVEREHHYIKIAQRYVDVWNR